jgi:hypothetical protein
MWPTGTPKTLKKQQMWPIGAPKNFEEAIIKNFSKKMFKGSLHGNNTTSKLINVKTCRRGRITPKMKRN